MSDAVWEIEQGMLTYIAGGLVATLGYDPLQTPLALELKRVVHPDDMPGLRAILKEGKPFTDFKHRLLTQEGGYRWHRTSGTPIRDEAGTLLGYRGVTRNTHEAELTAQRERLASQIGSSLTSVLSLDDLLRRIVAEMHEILGFYHVHVRLYDPDRDVLVLRQEAGQGSSIIRQMLHHIKMEGYPFIEPLAARSLSPVVVNNLREEATHIPNPRLPEARALAALPLFRGQRLLGVLAVHDDTVGRFTSSEVAILQNIAAQASIAVENARLYKALESQAANLELLVRERTAEILKERERIQTIVENTGEGVLLLNEDGLVEYANQAMADIVGLPRKRLVGRVVPLLTYRRLLASPKPLRELVTVFKMNQSWTGRLRFRRPDGSEYDGELKLSAVKNDTGEDTNFVVLLRDVTAQMEVERMRKRFVENVSHELRTPVANIKLYETLLRTGSEAKRDQYLSTLQKQVGRLERLVEDLLDLSRIEQGRVTVQLDMLNLNTLVQETIAIHRLKAEERGLSLNLELAEGLPPLLGDRERLGQVITNLLANAINYTEPGDRIGVRTWLDADTDQVMLALWDTGFGIAPKHQPFIFNRFYRSQHAKDSGRPGTGLGLAIVKEIVTSHGGSITVESKLNVGTTFVVALPTSLIQA
jgi:PAS domain S-box-containing protein